MRRHITTVMESKFPSRLFEVGKGPTKSIPMDSQGSEGTANGFSNPYGFWLFGLLRLHVAHVSQ